MNCADCFRVTDWKSWPCFGLFRSTMIFYFWGLLPEYTWNNKSQKYCTKLNFLTSFYCLHECWFSLVTVFVMYSYLFLLKDLGIVLLMPVHLCVYVHYMVAFGFILVHNTVKYELNFVSQTFGVVCSVGWGWVQFIRIWSFSYLRQLLKWNICIDCGAGCKQ